MIIIYFLNTFREYILLLFSIQVLSIEMILYKEVHQRGRSMLRCIDSVFMLNKYRTCENKYFRVNGDHTR